MKFCVCFRFVSIQMTPVLTSLTQFSIIFVQVTICFSILKAFSFLSWEFSKMLSGSKSFSVQNFAGLFSTVLAYFSGQIFQQ